MDKIIDILETDFSNTCQIHSIKKRKISSNSSEINKITYYKKKINRTSCFFEPIPIHRKRHRSNAISE